MSALAQLIHSSGYKVRGSDLNPDLEIAAVLESKGIEVYKGHQAGRLNSSDVVIYNTVIKGDNPEYKEAQEMNLTLFHRAEALKIFLEGKKTVAVTGTHGKTTTTYILANVLRNSGLDVGMILGGISKERGNNFVKGKDLYVVELDESDGTFLDFEPDVKVLTSLDSDHLEFYKEDFEQLRAKFKLFLEKEGLNIISSEDTNLRQLISGLKANLITFGFDEDANYRAKIIKTDEFGTEYQLFKNGSFISNVKLPLYGYKTALNSLPVFALADILGLDLFKISLALNNLEGIKRRYEIRYSSPKIKLIEDYAHHPSEIQEVIRTLRNYLNPQRLIVIFQPHKYSRTKYLWQEFRSCFKGADLLILTDIYPAFEEKIEGIESRILASQISGVNTVFLPISKVPEELLKVVREGDIIAVLGAGNINKICPKLELKLPYV